MPHKASLLLVPVMVALTRCAPATATASTHAPLADTMSCAAGLLGSMGYDVVSADERDRMVKAERLKHVTAPVSGAMDADRITVLIGHDGDYSFLQIIGETVGTSPALRFPARTRRVAGVVEGTPGRDLGVVRKWTSREVAADTRAVAQKCGQ